MHIKIRSREMMLGRLDVRNSGLSTCINEVRHSNSGGLFILYNLRYVWPDPLLIETALSVCTSFLHISISPFPLPISVCSCVLFATFLSIFT